MATKKKKSAATRAKPNDKPASAKPAAKPAKPAAKPAVPAIAEPRPDASADEWLVYADALQERNDPRGTLIVLEEGVRTGKTSPAKRDAFLRDSEALLGPARKHLDAYRLTWRWGTLAKVEVLFRSGPKKQKKTPKIDVAPLEAILRAPVFVSASSATLALVGVAERADAKLDLSPAIKLLVARKDRAPTSIELIDERAARATRLVSRDYEPPTNLVDFGSLDDLGSSAYLESLVIVTADATQVNLAVLEAPNLTSFTLRSLCGPSDDLLGALAEAKCPSLASIELRMTDMWIANAPSDGGAYLPYYASDDALPALPPIGDVPEAASAGSNAGEEDEDEDEDEEDEEDDFDWSDDHEELEPVSWDALRPALARFKKMPRLRRLALQGNESVSAIVTMLFAVGLPPGLVELDLSDTALGKADVKTFVSNKAKLGSLKRLIAQRTLLSDKDVAALRKIGLEVVSSRRAGEARYRYVVGQE